MPASMLPLSLLLALPAAGQDLPAAGRDLDADPAPLVVRVALGDLPKPIEVEEERPGPSVLPASLRVAVVPGEETVLDLDLQVQTTTDDVELLDLVGDALAVREVLLDGRPATLTPGRSGWRALVLDRGPGTHRVRLRGTVATATPSLDLPLLLPPRTRVEVAGDWQLSSPGGLPVPGAGDRALQLPPGERLALSWQPPRPPPPRPQVVRASAGVDLQVDSAGVSGRARLRYVVVDQPAASLSFRLAGGTDLDVTGPAVSGFSRSGDSVRVDLARPMEGAVDVEVSWRATAPGATAAAVAVPVPVSTSGVLDEGWVTVRSGDQGTVVPDAGRGLAAVPAARVPAWARGMVPGQVVTALALTTARPDLRLAVLDLSPLEAPPTFVDEARFEVAYAAHGRALLRATLDVRNDRSQYLPIDLPPGAVLLGVRVAGRVVQPVRRAAEGDRAERLYVPLEKSVETLSGLVAFPVELGMLLPDQAWQARGERQLALPGIHAPVAQARWELLLPPGVAVREVDGDLALEGELDTRTATLAYGRAVATKSAEVDVENALRKQDEAEQNSREAWNTAYRAYQDNEFEAARGLLEQSLAWDQGNEAAQQLLGNVQVLLGEDEEAARSDQSRRIRAMARSKLAGAESEQLELKEEAQQAVRAGDYDKAEEALYELRTLTERLVQVEDLEVVDQKVALEETEKQLAEVRAVQEEAHRKEAERRSAELAYKSREEAKKKARAEPPRSPAKPSSSTTKPSDAPVTISGGQTVVVDGDRFDLPDVDEGELAVIVQRQILIEEDAPPTDGRAFAQQLAGVDEAQVLDALSALGYTEAPAAPDAPEETDWTGVDPNGDTGGFAYDFDGEEINGELLQPDGALLLPTTGSERGEVFASEAFEGGYVEGEIVEGVEGGVMGGVAGGVVGGVVHGAGVAAGPSTSNSSSSFGNRNHEVITGRVEKPDVTYVYEESTVAGEIVAYGAGAGAAAGSGGGGAAGGDDGVSYDDWEDGPLLEPEPEPSATPMPAAAAAPGWADDDVYFDDIEEFDEAEAYAPRRSATRATASRAGVRNTSAEIQVVERRRPRLRLPSFGMKKQAAEPPPPPPPAPVVHAPPRGPSLDRERPVGPSPDRERPVGPSIAETHPYGPMVAPPQTSPDALDMDPAVTAAPLLRPVPRAGDRLALTRQLVPAGQPLSITLSYKTRSRD